VSQAKRTLTSKHLRYILWKSTDGKCAICGDELTADWHADHVVPWSETKRTNVHEMQPLCAPCNLSKGARQ
jgi:5-methylcytosine-specific restriction endonuclease McrA